MKPMIYSRYKLYMKNNSEATLNGSTDPNQYTTDKYNKHTTNTHIIVYIVILMIIAAIIIARLKLRKT